MVTMAKFKIILIALATFRSAEDHKTLHSKGATVETTDVKRVNSLIKRGLAEIVSIEEINDGGKVEDSGAAGNGGDNTQKTDPSKVLFDGKEYEPQTFKEALVGIGVTCAPSIGVNGLTKKIGDLTEDQKKALAEKLVNE